MAEKVTAPPAVPVTVVVPMLDAGQRVRTVHAAIRAALDAQYPRSEILFVDDGSTDRTWSRIEEVAAHDPLVTGVRLQTNVGQVGALCAGFRVARGRVVLMIDDDLDGDPAELGAFVEAIEGGAAFASGWRVGPRTPIRSLGSRLYNARVRRTGFPLHDAGCGYNAFSRDLARAVSERGWDLRLHRFKLVVVSMTDRVVEIRFPVRRTTESHYGIRRLAAAWLDTELTFGELTPASARLLGVVVPSVIAGVGGARAIAPGRAVRERAIPTTIAVCAGALAAAGASVLHIWWSVERRARSEPPFHISGVIGTHLDGDS